MTRVLRTSISWPGSRRILAPVLLATVVTVAGCGATSSTPAPSNSAPAGSTSFRQCLEKHGIKPPAGRPAGGTRPTPPAGAASSAFRKAVQACGGFGGGGFGGGGFGGG